MQGHLQDDAKRKSKQLTSVRQMDSTPSRNILPPLAEINTHTHTTHTHRLHGIPLIIIVHTSTTSLHQVCVVPGSGLMFAANESSDIFTYFIPSLAPAPKWCSYLDSITEELEENAEAAVCVTHCAPCESHATTFTRTDHVCSSWQRACLFLFCCDGLNTTLQYCITVVPTIARC